MVTVLASNEVVWIRWCNGYRARLECGSVDTNPGRIKPKIIQLVYAVSPLNTQHLE